MRKHGQSSTGCSVNDLVGFATGVEIGVGGQIVPDLCGSVVLVPESWKAQEDEIDDEEFEHEVEADQSEDLRRRHEQRHGQGQPQHYVQLSRSLVSPHQQTCRTFNFL